MGRTVLTHCLRFAVVIGILVGFALGAHAQLYVAYYHAGIINKYDADTGALITERFIHGLDRPRSLCLANGMLYVTQTGGGSVSTYNADTGALINAQFIPSLNMPQAMTVSGDSLYVTSFPWQWQWQQGMNSSACLVGKYNAVTGAGINSALVKTNTQAIALAATDQKLYVAGGSQMDRQDIYDANTGAPLKGVRALEMLVGTADSFALREHTLWLSEGANSSFGSVFKFDLDAGAQPISLGPFPPPIIRNLDHPLSIAVSGDVLFVSGPGSTVSTYDANTGDLIKSGLIPDHSDQITGIAVTPRAPSNQLTWAEIVFGAKSSFRNAALWSSVNGDYLYLASAILVGTVVLGFLAVLFFRSVPKLLGPNPAVPASAEPVPTPVEPPLEAISAQVEEVQAPESTPETTPAMEGQLPEENAPIAPSFWSPMKVAVVVLVTITLGFAGFLAWLGSQALPSPEVFMHGPDTHDLVGIWSYENTDRDPSQKPVMLSLEIYATRLNFSTGNGPHFMDGRWHDNGFWCQAADGSGEVEVAKVTSPEEIEFHRSTIDPANQTVDHLYKDRGSDAELAAIAAKYPSPVTYPPPASVFKYWMSEYDLKCLPWRVDHLEVTGEQYARGLVYVYRSDDPKIPPLKITVKNHRVVKVSSGDNA